MRGKEIQYNPALSVKENAKRNGVSEATIRHHIKENDIDRRFDRKQNIIDDCRKILKKHPDATRVELKQKTGHSETTIRKYWKYISTEEELTEFNNKKAKRRQLRQSNNFYATHPSVVKDLLTYETFNDRILEPFCGTGLISDAIKEFGYEVESYDLINRGYGNVGDFFKVDYPRGCYDIVTNPPYDKNLLTDIILRCLDLCSGKVALLLTLGYLTGKERYNRIFKKYPLKTVYVYVNQISIGKNGVFDKSLNNNLLDYAWFIWEKGYKGKTEIRWIQNTLDREPKTILNKYIQVDVRQKINAIIEEEHENTKILEENKTCLPCPTKQDLYKAKEERYDASRYLCYAFRRKEDKHKDVEIPLGNMNGGYPFKIGNREYPTSEHAYIMGLFSEDTKRHISIQNELLAQTNGYLAKSDVRRRNAKYGRKDWGEFNVEWMLFCIWQKVQGNKEFRELLMSIPEGATIIENSTFHPKPKSGEDKASFWGCRNDQQKAFHKMVQQYVTKQGGNSAEQDKKVSEYMNDCCNYGEYVGHNTMGKILMIVKKCLHEGTEPDINYDLLREKNIYLFGIPVSLIFGRIKIKKVTSGRKKESE